VALVLFALLALGSIGAVANLVSGEARLPEVAGVAGWLASDLEAFHLRDASGRPVLVVRGALQPSGTTPPPEVRLELLGASGRPIAATTYRAQARLTGAELSPPALARRLEAGVGASGARPVGGVSGFTLLVPDPPEEARSFRVSLVER
jgi:hypothetical protein